MRALVLSEFSGPDGIALADVPAPMAGDDGRSVRIEVHAAGVSFADMLISRGLYQLKPPLPFIPGLEVAGVVSDVPAGSRFAVCGRVGGFLFWAAVRRAA